MLPVLDSRAGILDDGAVRVGSSGGRRWLPALLAGSALLASVSTKAEVRQVFRPERFLCGDTNIRRVQPIDDAAWIWVEGAESRSDASRPFVRFRKAFAWHDKDLRIDVSADARFVLLLDGREIARGPHQGFVGHWYYETYDIAALMPGEHLLEAIVFDLGSRGPKSLMTSGRGGFVLKADGAYDEELTTGKAEWTAAVFASTRFGETTGDRNTMMAGGENIVEGTGFLDEDNLSRMPVTIVRPPIRENPYGHPASGWVLFPSERPDQVRERCSPGSIKAVQPTFDQKDLPYVRQDAENGWTAKFDALLKDEAAVRIPPGTELRFLWDLGDYYCAFPILETDGGRGSEIRWTWTEGLRDGKGYRGNRNEFLGKKVPAAMWDTFLPDGRRNARFTVPWWRSGRWVQVSVRTGDDPLVLTGLALLTTRYPLEPEASFECDDASLADVQRLCLRGLQNCLHETFVDCPYFEQQMYAGDTRVEMLTLNTVAWDDRPLRFGIGLFDYARHGNDLVPMHFPSRHIQESATYSMCWAMMIGDYALWHGTNDFLRSRMPGVRHTLDAISLSGDKDGLLTNLPGWNFMDWVPSWGIYGNAPEGRNGISSLNNLLYVYALRSVADAEESLGNDNRANAYRHHATSLGQVIVSRFWSEEKGLLADTCEKDSFSEHGQCLALLTGILSEGQAKRAFEGLVANGSLARTTVYFSHYLFDAYIQFGRSDLFLDRLDLWRDYVRQGLRTPKESPGEWARSDCHAWGAHPLYHLHTGVAGVRPAKCGYSEVVVAPQPGGLKWIRATTPTPNGSVRLDLHFDGDRISGVVELPRDLNGKFVWRNKSFVLVSGINDVENLQQLK